MYTAGVYRARRELSECGGALTNKLQAPRAVRRTLELKECPAPGRLQPLLLGRGLHPELTEVMIHVLVRKRAPLLTREIPEHGTLAPRRVTG